MTSERVNEYYWWVLDRIKELLETTPSDKPLRYELSHVGAAGVPNNEMEGNIIRKLEELKAIQIMKEFPRESGYSHRSIFELIVLQPKFDEVYEEFRIKEVLKNQAAEQALPPSGYMPVNYKSQTTDKLNADEIVNSFSHPNYPFVLMILKQIALLTEFSINDEISYQLQSSHGQPLIQERALLEKFQAKGLFRNLGEDGISGIATLSDIDIELIKQVIAEMEMRASGVISQEEFEDVKKRYDQTVQELRKSNQPSDLQERYNKVIGEIGSNLKNLNVPLQADNQTPFYSPDDLNTDHNNGNQIKPTQSASASGKLNKREIKKIISIAKQTCNLGIKEKSLLTILSDLEPHKTTDLTNQVPTKAYKKLKESLQKKIGHLGLHIDTIKGSGLNPTSYYQLKYLPQVAT